MNQDNDENTRNKKSENQGSGGQGGRSSRGGGGGGGGRGGRASNDTQVRIVGAAVNRPPSAGGSSDERAAVTDAQAGVLQTPQEPLHVSLEVENPSNNRLYVWASRRAYDYNPDTRVLTIYLTEHTPPPPPGIVMISDHPRTPQEVEVSPNGRATIDVSVPPVIRRRVPGQGLGMSFVEVPIGQVDRVEFHVQSASQPFEHKPEESPEEHRRRLLDHGALVQATVTPGGQTSTPQRPNQQNLAKPNQPQQRPSGRKSSSRESSEDKGNSEKD